MKINQTKKIVKVAILGSRNCQKSKLIESLLKKLRVKFDKNLEIVSTGSKTGVDSDVKNLSLLYQLNYKEVLPYYSKWNSYCVDKPYMYKKPYMAKYYWMNLYKTAAYVDYCIIITDDQDKFSKNIIKFLEKENKKYIIYE